MAPQFYYDSKGMSNSRVVILIYVVKKELRAFAHLWTLTLQLQLPDMENSPFFIPHPFSYAFFVTIKEGKISEYMFLLAEKVMVGVEKHVSVVIR